MTDQSWYHRPGWGTAHLLQDEIERMFGERYTRTFCGHRVSLRDVKPDGLGGGDQCKRCARIAEREAPDA